MLGHIEWIAALPLLPALLPALLCRERERAEPRAAAPRSPKSSERAPKFEVTRLFSFSLFNSRFGEVTKRLDPKTVDSLAREGAYVTGM